MKHLIRYTTAGVILSALLFGSCKKQTEEPVMREAQSQPSSSVTICKPTAYGMYNSVSGKWTNIVQKWYASNKVQFFQTYFSGAISSAGLVHSEPLLYIKWGEVS